MGKDLGADRGDPTTANMVAQVRALGVHRRSYRGLRHTQWDAAVELIRPQGGIVSIDGTDSPMHNSGMKKIRRQRYHWGSCSRAPCTRHPA
jgi:hypothetical protein